MNVMNGPHGAQDSHHYSIHSYMARRSIALAPKKALRQSISTLNKILVNLQIVHKWAWNTSGSKLHAFKQKHICWIQPPKKLLNRLLIVFNFQSNVFISWKTPSSSGLSKSRSWSKSHNSGNFYCVSKRSCRRSSFIHPDTPLSLLCCIKNYSNNQY